MLRGQLDVLALMQIRNLLRPILKIGPRHIKQAPSILRNNIRTVGVPLILSELGNDARGVGGERVNALDEARVDLDLVQLVDVGNVSVPVEFLREGRDAIVEELALLVALGRGLWFGSAGGWGWEVRDPCRCWLCGGHDYDCLYQDKKKK